MRDVPRRMRVTLLLGAGSLCLLGAHSRAPSRSSRTSPRTSSRRLDSEKLIVLEDVSSGGSESFVIAYLIFDRRREDVMELLRLAERQTEYRPELDSVKTVRKLENGRIDEQHLRILFTEIVYRSAVRRRTRQQPLRMEARSGFRQRPAAHGGFLGTQRLSIPTRIALWLVSDRTWTSDRRFRVSSRRA